MPIFHEFEKQKRKEFRIFTIRITPSIVKILLLIIGACIYVAFGASGQRYTVVTKTWELADGLANRHVNSIIEDKSGFIWLGTRNGLQRFDGKEFKTWGEQTNFPQFEDIRGLIIDDKGWLWAWNHTTQEFVFIHTISEKVHSQQQHFQNKFPKRFHKNRKTWYYVSFRACDKKGTLFAVANHPDELITYHSSTGFKKYPLHLGKGITSLEIHAVNDDGIVVFVKGKKNRFVLLTHQGKIRQYIELNTPNNWNANNSYRPERENIVYEYIPSADNQSLGNFISWKLDWLSGRLIRKKQPATLRTLNSRGLGAVISGNKLELWKKDRLIYTEETEQLGKVFSDAYPIFVDRKKRLWFVSSFGMARMTIRPSGFKNLVKKTPKNPLNFNTTTRGLVVRNDTLFAIFEFHGIAAIPLKNPGNCITIQGKFTPDAHYFNSFSLIDNNGSLVLVKGGKLIHITGSTTREVPIEGVDSKGRHLTLEENVVVNSIFKTGNRFWIGINGGVWVVNTAGKGTFYKIGSATVNQIRAIKLVDNSIFLCADEGLFRFDSQKQRIEKIRPGKISDRAYFSMYKSKKGDIYFGTDKGLVIWNYRKNSAREYSEKDGLSQNLVTGVYPDANGNLWIATFFGLNRLHLATGKITAYYEEDGINHSEFNFLSHFQDENGKIYFGGLNGITVIDPEKIAERPSSNNKIHLTKAELFSEDANQLTELTGILRLRQHFTYRTDDRFVRLKFAIPNLNNPDDILYAWKISGLHDTWNYQKENGIQLTNLPYGDQELLIKGKTDEGIWTKPMRISIYVEPPFYLRLWFLILSGILMILGVILVFRLRTNALRKRELQLRKEIRAATEKIRQDNELIRKQADELRVLDQTKSRFFTNVTHELKTPLALIKGPLGSVLNSGKLDKEAEQHVLTAKRNTEHLLKLVSSLLDLSKLESGVMKPDETEVNLFEFLGTIIAHFESHIRQARIELDVQFKAAKNLTVRLDKNKCETILNNILSNAVKFTNAGGQITVLLKDDGDSISFSVTDTGRGIPKEEQERIFERFYQVSTEGITEEGGTGIGLSLSQELVKVMNGTLTVQSEPGVGSTFELRLPKKELPVTKKGITIHEPLQTETNRELPGNGGRILIVEDNPDLQSYLSSILFNKGFSTLNALNGKRALELLGELSNDELPDLILSDIMMPEMDGYQLLTYLKQDERYWNIPVIILTARSELQDKLKALRIGVDDYLLKPFEEEELVARVQNLVKHLVGRNETTGDSEENSVLSLSPVDQHWMEQLEAFVQEHFTEEEFDIAQMHAHFAMSSSTFLRKVKALTGMAPVDYLREFRLVAARTMLENKEKTTVSEVAFAVGFGNAKSFSRSFKNRFGKLPGDYLR